MRLSAAVDGPRPEDVGQEGRLEPEQWTEVVAVAAAELARRTRPALVSYLGLLALAAWGSGSLYRRDSIELGVLLGVGTAIFVVGMWRRSLMARPGRTADWWRAFGSLTVVNGALMGALGATMTIHHAMASPALIYWLVLAGTCAGAATSLTPSPVLGRIFLWSSLGPLAIASTWMATGPSYAIPAIFATFLIFMTGQSARASRNYWEGIVSEVLRRRQALALDAARAEAQRALNAQNVLVAELGAFRDAAERDYAVAARVFAGILERSCLKLRSLKATVSPVDRFNGDLVMAAPCGDRIRVFLGDFTGHGLSAAVGALPIADVFFSSAARRAPLADVLCDMNGVIRRNLPRGMFLAAFVAEIDPGRGRMIFWNGGLPAPLLVGSAGQIVERLASRDVALGVVPGEDFEPTTDEITMRPGEGIFAYSDGVIEAASPDGELFGGARLEQVIAAASPADFFSDAVGQALLQHRHGLQNDDDVTLLELRNDEFLVVDLARLAGLAPGGGSSSFGTRDETLAQ